MDRPPAAADLDELLGAYALDALEPDEAQRVEFEVTQGPKGPQADQVRPI